MAKKLLQAQVLTAGSPEELQEFVNVELAKGQTLNRLFTLDNKKGLACCLVFEVDNIEQTIEEKVNALINEGSGGANEPIFVAVINDSERVLIAELIESRADFFIKLSQDPETHPDDQDRYASNAIIYSELIQRFEENPTDTNSQES